MFDIMFPSWFGLVAAFAAIASRSAWFAQSCGPLSGPGLANGLAVGAYPHAAGGVAGPGGPAAEGGGGLIRPARCALGGAATLDRLHRPLRWRFRRDNPRRVGRGSRSPPGWWGNLLVYPGLAG